MYKILFVDDEKSVLEYLPLAIEWEELNITEIYTASDAMNAFEIVKEVIPDIIIADVEMPGITGLEFCRKIKKTNPEIEVVILSAFDKFEYAKKAIGMGVEDYLLKPVDEEELWELMKRIVTNLEVSGKKKLKSQSIEAHALEKEMGGILRDLFEDAALSNKLNEKFPFLAEYENIYMLVRQNDSVGEVKKELQDILNTEFICLRPEEGFYIVLLRKNIQISMEQKLEELIEKFKRQDNDAMISYSCFKKDETYEQALKRCFIGLERVFYQQKNLNFTKEELFLPNLKEGLNLLSEEGEISVLQKEILQAVVAAKQRKIEPVKICNMLMDVLITLKTYLVRYWQEEAIEIFRRITVFTLFRCGSFEAMCQMIERCLGELQYFVVNQQKNHGNSYIVRIAKEYTAEHYQESDLSLQDVADAVGTSRTYFSKIFKDLTSEKYWDYLSRYRIDKAKSLLSNTNLSQAEISLQVGYTSEFHFSRKFKEIVGVSPNKFRKS